MHDQLTGIGVSAGRATGPLVRMGTRLELPAPLPVTDRQQEMARARHALESVAADLLARAERCADATAAAILQAAYLMAADPVLLDDVAAKTESGVDAPHAIFFFLTAPTPAIYTVALHVAAPVDG